MKQYYHVTPKYNWKNISNEGLIPKIGKLSSNLGETIPAIYLFKNKEDMNNALMNWLGEEYDKETLLCLEINLPSDYWIYNSSDSFEVIHYDIIPSNYIRILREE